MAAPAHAQQAPTKRQSTSEQTNSGTQQPRPTMSSTSINSQAAQPQAPPVSEAPPASDAPASAPSTEEILRRITDGALKTDRAVNTRRQVEKPWLADTQLVRPDPKIEGTALGQRIERVHSPAGTYCVVIPNATAYRNSNGVNLAVASNCP